MHERNCEIASRPLPLEYGGGGGFITQVGRKRIASPLRVESVEDGRVLQGYACLYNKPVVDGGVKSICVGAFDAWLSDRRNNVGLAPAVTTVLVSPASLPDFGRPRPQYRHCFGELPSNARINVSLYSVWGTSHAV